jgi:hypothetical protein
MRMVQHRLEGTLLAAEHAAQPRDHLLLLEPVTPRRILRTADMLDHGEVAEAENLALTALGSIVHGSACRVSATASSILQSTPDASVIPVCTSSSQVPVVLG